MGTVGCALECLDLQTHKPSGCGEGRLEIVLALEQEVLLSVIIIPQNFLVVAWDGSPQGSASVIVVESSGVPQDPEFPGWLGGHLVTTSAGVKNQHMLDKLSAPTESQDRG